MKKIIENGGVDEEGKVVEDKIKRKEDKEEKRTKSTSGARKKE